MIIFLNGCSSSGKSTIAKAIQHLEEKPWLLIGIDTVFHMMPAQYIGVGEKAHEGFQFIPDHDEEGPLMKVQSGPWGKALARSLPEVIQVLANDGHNLIIDEVLLTSEVLQAYVQALSHHRVYFTGVMCDLSTLKEREILRGDRAWGLGRDQMNRVHQPPIIYDFTVDTTNTSSFTCAKQILAFITNTPDPSSFRRLYEIFARRP